MKTSNTQQDLAELIVIQITIYFIFLELFSTDFNFSKSSVSNGTNAHTDYIYHNFYAKGKIRVTIDKSNFPLDIPYIAVFKASNINEALLKIVKKNGYKNFTVKNLNGKVLKQTKLEGVNHTKYNEYINFKNTLFDLKFDYSKTIHIEIMEMPKEDNDFSIIQEYYRE